MCTAPVNRFQDIYARYLLLIVEMDDVDDGLGSEVNTPRDGDLSGQTNAPLDTSVGHLCMSLFIALNFNT